MDKARKLIQKYVNAASDLAESVKHDIVHEGIITDDTVNKLNKFYIVNNELAELTSQLTNDDDNETNRKLN